MSGIARVKPKGLKDCKMIIRVSSKSKGADNGK